MRQQGKNQMISNNARNPTPHNQTPLLEHISDTPPQGYDIKSRHVEQEQDEERIQR